MKQTYVKYLMVAVFDRRFPVYFLPDRTRDYGTVRSNQSRG